MASSDEDEDIYQSSDDLSPGRRTQELAGKDGQQDKLQGEVGTVVVTSDDAGKETAPQEKKRGKRSQPIKEGSSSSEERTIRRTSPKKKPLGSKSVRAKREAVNPDSVVQVWGSTERRRRGRPPTTGEYREITEAKKAVNDEKERELRLAMEARAYSMEETLAILRRSHGP